MFDGFDMGKMTEMMSQIQSKAEEMKEQSANIQFTEKVGGGLVEVTANGNGEVIDMNIDETMMDDKSALEILLISAVNEVMQKVENNKKSQAMGMMGGMNPFDSAPFGK
jgi:DNA-binding YbaB/EbfC family protein